MLEKLKQYLSQFKYIKNETELANMLEHFEKTAPHSFGQTHYELADASGLSSNKWEEFRSMPLIQKYIEEQMAKITEVNKAKVMLNLGNAKTSTDVQTAKFVQQMAKDDKTRSSKPFTIQFLPEDTLRYKKALLTVYKQLLDDAPKWDIIDTIFAAIPPTQEDLDAISKAKVLAAS